jgi:hypothetical protein
MVNSNSTPKVRKSAAVSSFGRTAHPQADILDLPINIINERLNRAHATLDLLYSIAVDERGEDILETLCRDSLETAMHSAMQNIEEALKAANREVAHG